MGKWKRDRDDKREVDSIRAEWENSRHLSSLPSSEGEVRAALYFLERERLNRYRNSTMINMLDGTPSLSWVLDGPNFTPSTEIQIELAQLIKETLLTQKIEKPKKFPYGGAYAGWVVKSPFWLQAPRSLEDEPLFEGSLVAPALEIILVSNGVVAHEKDGIINYYIDFDKRVEKFLLLAASQTNEENLKLLTSWKLIKPKRFSFFGKPTRVVQATPKASLK